MTSCTGSGNSRKSFRLVPTQVTGFNGDSSVMGKHQYSEFTILCQVWRGGAVFLCDVLRHQFRQDPILGLDLLLQIGDLLLLCVMVGPRFRLKGSRAVLEELLLPAVEDRGLESLLVTQLRDRHLLQQTPP